VAAAVVAVAVAVADKPRIPRLLARQNALSARLPFSFNQKFRLEVCVMNSHWSSRFASMALSFSLVLACTPQASPPQATGSQTLTAQTPASDTHETVRLVLQTPGSFRTQQVDPEQLKFLSLTVTGADLAEPLRHTGPALIPVTGEEITLEINDIPTVPGQLRVVTVQGYDAEQQALSAFTGKGFYYSQQAGVINLNVDRRHLLLGLSLEALLQSDPEASMGLDLNALQAQVDIATGYDPENTSFAKDPLLFNPEGVKTLLLAGELSSETLLPLGEGQSISLTTFLRTPNGCPFEEEVQINVNAPGALPQIISPNSSGLQSQNWVLPPGKWQMTARRADGSLLQTNMLNLLSEQNMALAAGDSAQNAWRLNGLAGTIQGYQITTVAGGGYGDQGPATQAFVGGPRGFVQDNQGNILVAAGHRIRKIAPDGIISTLAGTYVADTEMTAGFSGDGGSAHTAELNGPDTLVLDSGNNLIFSDKLNHRIRKIDPNGVISTIAGTGVAGFGGDGGQALQAQLNEPTGLVLDAEGNLYIGDTNNRRVRKVAPDGVISTVAGNGELGKEGNGGQATAAQLGRIAQIGFDPQGRLLISDNFYGQIRQVDHDGTISVRVGDRSHGSHGNGIPAVSADLSGVASFDFDSNGQLHFYGGCRIYRVDENGLLQTFAGSGSCAGFEENNGDNLAALDVGLPAIHSLKFLDDGSLVFSNHNEQRLRKISPAGQTSTLAGGGVGDGLPATSARLFFPKGVALDPQGRVLIADSGNNRVRRIESDGRISTVAGNGFKGLKETEGNALQVRLSSPHDIASDAAGNLFIADTANIRLLQVTPAGMLSTLPLSANYPTGLALDSQDRLYVAETDARRVYRLNADKTQKTLMAGIYNPDNIFSGNGGPATQAAMGGAWDVYVDAQDHIYIANNFHNTVRKVDGSTGIISAFAGNIAHPSFGELFDGGPAINARLMTTFGVTGDRCGNIYITSHHRIRKVDVFSGIIETIAGSGNSTGFAGDGGDALQGKVALPAGLVVADDGSIYIGDSSNHRVRKLTPY